MTLFNMPHLLLATSFVVLWLSGWAGVRLQAAQPEEREEFGIVLGATLTLLGLLIGFTFSMAIGRYDQRKTYEEEEANAIGTEYLRAGLLPAADATRVRTLLRKYLDQRVLFYTALDAHQLEQINASTAQLQADLWFAVQAPAAAQPTPVIALAVSGMNDVLNSQGYTQAAWWNRIPLSAWGLMGSMAVCCNLLFGFNARETEAKPLQFLVLPMIVAVSLLLIADLDSPRGGLIRVRPQNLVSLSNSLPGQ